MSYDTVLPNDTVVSNSFSLDDAATLYKNTVPNVHLPILKLFALKVIAWSQNGIFFEDTVHSNLDRG